MTKMLLGIILIALLSWLLSPIAWWIFALPSFIIPLLLKAEGRKAFSMGFLAVGCLNLICIGLTNIQNEGVLAAKIGEVFQGLPAIVVVLLSVLIPALLAECAAGLLHHCGFSCNKVKLLDKKVYFG